MFKKEDCYLIGKFIKTHGVNGELILKKNNDLLEKYKLESVLVDTDGGLVPFFISPGGLHTRSHSTFRIKFDDINTEKRSLRFIDCDVYILMNEAPTFEQEEELDTDLLIGFHVVDKKHGKLGPIEAILDYSGNILLKLTINKEEVLIPFVEENILEIDQELKLIKLNIPEGLLDIYFE